MPPLPEVSPTQDDHPVSRLAPLAERCAERLRRRSGTIAVAEGAAGGLISASLLAIPGASAFYRGGAVIYTLAAAKAFVRGEVEAPPGLRGASEPFARYLAESVRLRLDATWGVGEGGAAGPTGNAYGDPPGHAWVAVTGLGRAEARHVLTGKADRPANMVAFAATALELLAEMLEDGALPTRAQSDA